MTTTACDDQLRSRCKVCGIDFARPRQADVPDGYCTRCWASAEAFSAEQDKLADARDAGEERLMEINEQADRDALLTALAMELKAWPESAAQAKEVMPEGWYWRGPGGAIHVGGGVSSFGVSVSDWRERREEIWGDGDAINPGHYRAGKVECIDALAAATAHKTGIEAVCTANAIKYLWRYEAKGGAEDVRKARWYIERLLSELEGGECK